MSLHWSLLTQKAIPVSLLHIFFITETYSVYYYYVLSFCGIKRLRPLIGTIYFAPMSLIYYGLLRIMIFSFSVFGKENHVLMLIQWMIDWVGAQCLVLTWVSLEKNTLIICYKIFLNFGEKGPTCSLPIGCVQRD